MVDTLNNIKPFKTRDTSEELKLAEDTPFILYKCKLRNNNDDDLEYDYLIMIEEDNIYPVYVKDYNLIVNTLTSSYPNKYKENTYNGINSLGFLAHCYSVKRLHPDNYMEVLLNDSNNTGYMYIYSSVHSIYYLPNGKKR